MKLELPTLNESKCNSCQECVAVCPTQCLAMSSHYPWLPRPLDCISCTLCVLLCPTEALEMALIHS